MRETHVNWKMQHFLLCPPVCFPALVPPTFKAGKENTFNENLAVSEMNTFYSSILKYSRKEEVTAAPIQAAWWAVLHLWQSTCPGSQAVAWKSGSPRPGVAHLAEQPNNFHILCNSLCSWNASSELHGWNSRKPGWNFTCFQQEVCQIELFVWTTRMN